MNTAKHEEMRQDAARDAYADEIAYDHEHTCRDCGGVFTCSKDHDELNPETMHFEPCDPSEVVSGFVHGCRDAFEGF